MRVPKANALHEVLGAVVGAAAQGERCEAECVKHRAHLHDGTPVASADHDILAADARANSYLTEDPPGVTVDGVITSVVGDNGRRVLIADVGDGVYIGGALILDRAHLGQVVRVLTAIYEREMG